MITSTDDQTFDDAVRFLESLYYQGIKLGLENTKRLLDRVDNPHHKIEFVHVAGTNGKGSVCAMIDAALRLAGYRTGLFTSPHLMDIRERCRVNGKMIGKNEFAELVFEVYRRAHDLFNVASNQQPTYFEFITVLGFLYFQRKHVDIAIVEVGMGGRLDSTNVISPLLSIITSISRDHTKSLGSDLTSIAREKAGIIKPCTPVICGAPNNEVQSMIARIADSEQSEVLFYGSHFSVLDYAAEFLDDNIRQATKIRWREETTILKTCLWGRHQSHNAVVAYAALRTLSAKFANLNDINCRQGIESAFWPGRLQTLPDGVLVDSAHNPDAIHAIVDSLRSCFPNRKWNILFAVTSDKDWIDMLHHLRAIAVRFVITELDHHRKQPAATIVDYVKNSFPEQIVELISEPVKGLNLLRRHGRGLAIGSIFLVGEVMKQYSDPDRLTDLALLSRPGRPSVFRCS